MTTDDCTNVFLMEDGFCTRCSTNHFRKSSSTDRVKPAPKRLTEDQVRTKQFQREARTLLKFLNEVYDMKVGIKFINRKNSVASTSKGHIRMGYQNMDDTYTNGQTEYVCCSHIIRKWAGKKAFVRKCGWKKRGGRITRVAVKGMPGIRYVLLHEFAHFLCAKRNGRGHNHDHKFQACLSEVCDLIPPEGIS